MTALDVSGSALEPYYLDHEKHYLEHFTFDDALTDISDEQINGVVYNAKNTLREKTQSDFPNITTKKHPLTMTLRVLILSIIALVFCNGFEIFLFQNQINEVISDLLALYNSKNETWIIENIFFN